MYAVPQKNLSTEHFFLNSSSLESATSLTCSPGFFFMLRLLLSVKTSSSLHFECDFSAYCLSNFLDFVIKILPGIIV